MLATEMFWNLIFILNARRILELRIKTTRMPDLRSTMGLDWEWHHRETHKSWHWMRRLGDVIPKRSLKSLEIPQTKWVCSNSRHKHQIEHYGYWDICSDTRKHFERSAAIGHRNAHLAWQMAAFLSIAGRNLRRQFNKSRETINVSVFVGLPTGKWLSCVPHPLSGGIFSLGDARNPISPNREWFDERPRPEKRFLVDACGLSAS